MMDIKKGNPEWGISGQESGNSIVNSISDYLETVNSILPGAYVFPLKGYANGNSNYQAAKQPAHSWKGAGRPSSLTDQQIKSWVARDGWIGAEIPAGLVVYDYDDKPSGMAVKEILDGTNTDYQEISTPHGYQFIFRAGKEIQHTKYVNRLGVRQDTRTEAGYIVFPTENTLGRTIIRQILKVSPAPSFLKEAWHDPDGRFHMGYPYDVEGSRNNDFYDLARRLFTCGVGYKVVKESLHLAYAYAVHNKDGFSMPELDASIDSALNKAGNHSSQAAVNDSNSDENCWEEPLLFENKKLPTFDTGILPDYCQSFVDELAEEMQVPADMPAMAVLGALSSCVFGKFHVRVRGTWTEPLNLFIVIAMPPSSKKTPVHKAVTESMRTYEHNERAFMKTDVTHALGEIRAKEKAVEGLSADYKKARKSGKGKEVLTEIDQLNKELDELKKDAVLPTYIIGGDATPEKVGELMGENDERLSIISPEGNDLFSMMSGRYTDKPYLELYLSSFNGETYKMKRIRRDVDLEKPLLSILLFVQNSVIENSDRSFKERGLMQRFLYCIPESNLGHRKIRPSLMSEKTKNNFDSNLNLLMRYRPKVSSELTLSAEADEILESLETTNEKLQGDPDVDDAYKEWRGKLIGNIIRIAGVLHVVDGFNAENMEKEISGETFIKASRLYGYLSAHAEKAFAISDGGENDNDARKLYKLIMKNQKEGIVGRREVQKKSHYFNNANGNKKMIAAEGDLTERNMIRVVTRGRKKMYEINPYIIESLDKR